MPEGALLYKNDVGTAPGMVLAKDGKTAILLPGPPEEMKPICDECSRVLLNKLSDKVFVSMNIRLKGPDEAPGDDIGEAPVADRISKFLDYKNPTVAIYAKPDGCIIRITAAGADREEALTLIVPVISGLTDILAPVMKEVYES